MKKEKYMKRVGLVVSDELYARIKEYREKTGVSIQHFVQTAITLYLDKKMEGKK